MNKLLAKQILSCLKLYVKGFNIKARLKSAIMENIVSAKLRLSLDFYGSCGINSVFFFNPVMMTVLIVIWNS